MKYFIEKMNYFMENKKVAESNFLWNSYYLWNCQIKEVQNIYELQSRHDIPKNNFQTYRTVRDSLSRSKIKDASDKKI